MRGTDHAGSTPRGDGDGAAPRRWTSLVHLVAGKRSKWLVLLLWVLVGVLISPFANKLESVTKNEQSSYLPGAAESTKVLDLEKRFPSGNTVPAVIVFHRSSGLTQQDQATVAADAKAIDALTPSTILSTAPGPPSADGKATLLIVPIAANDADADAGKILVDDVKAIRAAIEPAPAGLDVAVTGGAGFSADAIGVFNSINTTLLLWSVVIVTILLLITYRSPFLWLVPLISVLFADNVARGVAYGLAKAG